MVLQGIKRQFVDLGQKRQLKVGLYKIRRKRYATKGFMKPSSGEKVQLRTHRGIGLKAVRL